jgi:hypothetical protein
VADRGGTEGAAVAVRVAFLIAAHEHPGLLGQLVEQLDCDWGDIFIHLDAKTPEWPFRLSAPDATFVADRVNVRWGGYSQVRAECALIDAAPGYDRYVLLSGRDTLVAPLEQVYSRLDTGREFLRIDRALPSGQSQDHAVTRWWSERSAVASGWAPRLARSPLPVFHGSQWWALTGDCVRYLRDTIDRAADLTRFARHTHCPEEWLPHSIVRASRFADAITQDATRGDVLRANVHGCHYIDWTGGRSPKTLSLADLEQARMSGALFARKIT